MSPLSLVYNPIPGGGGIKHTLPPISETIGDIKTHLKTELFSFQNSVRSILNIPPWHRYLPIMLKKWIKTMERPAEMVVTFNVNS